MSILNKENAYEFLKTLEKRLNSELPGPIEMESWVRSTVKKAKANENMKHLRLPESAFLNGKALPLLFDLVKMHAGLSHEQAQRALLNEYHRTTPDISRQSPIRWERHPFRKVLGVSPSEIYEGWANPDKGRALTQSCPDFSLRDPFPHNILFEGKYFPSGSSEYAQRELVKNIYQAFFYRGLPSLAAKKNRPEWKYDYSCLLAYDASPKSTLISAWEGLHPHTRRSFWEGANVYVMIIPGATS